MVSGKTKRIVVIKDIPSNIIEEAILILKNEPKFMKEIDSKDPGSKNKRPDNDYIFKEAEMIINNYIKENNLSIKNSKNERSVKTGVFKNKILPNIIINLGLLGSIALLSFLILKLFWAQKDALFLFALYL